MCTELIEDQEIIEENKENIIELIEDQEIIEENKENIIELIAKNKELIEVQKKKKAIIIGVLILIILLVLKKIFKPIENKLDIDCKKLTNQFNALLKIITDNKIKGYEIQENNMVTLAVQNIKIFLQNFFHTECNNLNFFYSINEQKIETIINKWKEDLQNKLNSEEEYKTALEEMTKLLKKFSTDFDILLKKEKEKIKVQKELEKKLNTDCEKLKTQFNTLLANIIKNKIEGYEIENNNTINYLKRKFISEFEKKYYEKNKNLDFFYYMIDEKNENIIEIIINKWKEDLQNILNNEEEYKTALNEMINLLNTFSTDFDNLLQKEKEFNEQIIIPFYNLLTQIKNNKIEGYEIQENELINDLKNSDNSVKQFKLKYELEDYKNEKDTEDYKNLDFFYNFNENIIMQTINNWKKQLQSNLKNSNIESFEIMKELINTFDKDFNNLLTIEKKFNNNCKELKNQFYALLKTIEQNKIQDYKIDENSNIISELQYESIKNFEIGFYTKEKKTLGVFYCIIDKEKNKNINDENNKNINDENVNQVIEKILNKWKKELEENLENSLENKKKYTIAFKKIKKNNEKQYTKELNEMKKNNEEKYKIALEEMKKNNEEQYTKKLKEMKKNNEEQYTKKLKEMTDLLETFDKDFDTLLEKEKQDQIEKLNEVN